MVICGSYIFEFTISKDMKKKTMIIGKFPTYLLALCLTLIVKELKISVEQGRMRTTSNIIKH